jgi:hypothetical protein
MVVSIGSDSPNQHQQENQMEDAAFGEDKCFKNMGFGQQQRETKVVKRSGASSFSSDGQNKTHILSTPCSFGSGLCLICPIKCAMSSSSYSSSGSRPVAR